MEHLRRYLGPLSFTRLGDFFIGTSLAGPQSLERLRGTAKLACLSLSIMIKFSYYSMSLSVITRTTIT